MTKGELITALDTSMQGQSVLKLSALIENYRPDARLILDTCFHPKKEVAFRASWMLEYLYTQHPTLFKPLVEDFLSRVPLQNNLSCRRHFAKIVALLTAKKTDAMFREIIDSFDFDSLIDTLFTWLIDSETPVAIKAHCAQALAHLAFKQYWIKDELLQTIDYLVDQESVGFFGRARAVRKMLKNLSPAIEA